MKLNSKQKLTSLEARNSVPLGTGAHLDILEAQSLAGFAHVATVLGSFNAKGSIGTGPEKEFTLGSTAEEDEDN